MASGKPYYGGSIAITPSGKKGSTVEEMKPFDQYSKEKIPLLNPIELMGLPSPSKAVHKHGGMVKKFAQGGSADYGNDYRKRK